MNEKYILPIKLNDEERKSYEAWGLQKERVLIPLAILTIFLYALAVFWIFGKLWLIHYVDALWFRALIQSTWFIELSGGMAILLSFLIIKPLDILLDKIYHRPKAPAWLNISLSGDQATVNKVDNFNGQSGEIVSSETYSLSQLPEHMDVSENAILFQGTWLLIGENTIESIYAQDHQHPWMDHPASYPSSITEVKKLLHITQGYIASLEAKRKEQDWIRKHSADL